MDRYKIIRELYEERKHLTQVIRALESLTYEEGLLAEEELSQRPKRRRMSQRQRLEVSLRMKKYWAARRKK